MVVVVDEIRPLDAEIDSSSLRFMVQVSLHVDKLKPCRFDFSTYGDTQLVDGLDPEYKKRFLHHYNFPQYSVGETGRYGAPGRREIGHEP